MNSKFSDDLLAILDDISDGVVSLDRKGKYLSINKAAAEIFRGLYRDPQSIIGKAVWEVFPEAKNTIVEREILRALQDQTTIQYEFLYPPNQRWYETKGYPSPEGVILVFRDITSRKASA